MSGELENEEATIQGEAEEPEEVFIEQDDEKRSEEDDKGSVDAVVVKDIVNEAIADIVEKENAITDFLNAVSDIVGEKIADLSPRLAGIEDRLRELSEKQKREEEEKIEAEEVPEIIIEAPPAEVIEENKPLKRKRFFI